MAGVKKKKIVFLTLHFPFLCHWMTETQSFCIKPSVPDSHRCLSKWEGAGSWKGPGPIFKKEACLLGCPLSRVDFDVKEDEKGRLFRFLQTQVKPRLPLTCCELDKFLLPVQADKEAVSQWRGALRVWAAGGGRWWELDIQSPAQERWLDSLLI